MKKANLWMAIVQLEWLCWTKKDSAAAKNTQLTTVQTVKHMMRVLVQIAQVMTLQNPAAKAGVGFLLSAPKRTQRSLGPSAMDSPLVILFATLK